MRSHTILFAAVSAAIALSFLPSPAAAQSVIAPERLSAFKPLPDIMARGEITQTQIDLGRALYYDSRLSKSGKFSCNSCHDLALAYGADGKPVSPGHNGQMGSRNSPTVYNAAGHLSQFWDGRAKDVEEQAKGPVMNPIEMAMPSEKEVVNVLKSVPEYDTAFRAAFPSQAEPVTFDNMARAIGAFERKLVTPSRWDKFLNGDAAALTSAEKAGFNKFVDAGCATCHSGAYIGGSMYQKLGARKKWKDQSDPGRFSVTRREEDRLVFKVPGLRNIEKTAPYYHNGKVATLEQAVSLMSDYQGGAKLKQPDVDAIVTWLKTLTGEIPADYIRPRKLAPPSENSLSAGAAATDLPDRPARDAAIAKARAGASSLATEIRALLSAELAKGDFAAAVRACSDLAQTRTRAFAEKHGIAIRRVSLRNRNPDNAPDDFETGQLARLEQLQHQGVLPDEITEFTGGELRYLKPITIQPMCLSCHGSIAQLNDDVRRVLTEKYPMDLATGYKPGDLRGAISVTIPAK